MSAPCPVSMIAGAGKGGVLAVAVIAVLVVMAIAARNNTSQSK